MDLKPFKHDIDELINEFVEGGSTSFGELKKIWISKKLTYIFEASPRTNQNQAYFMQSLYAHCISYLVASSCSVSHRLGGLYCLYCLYETQPFKPPFKIYISFGELKQLRNVATLAKEKGIKVVSGLVKSMVERNLFMYGFVDINEDRVNEVMNIQNARVQIAYNKLFANTRVEDFIYMEMVREVDVDLIKKKSREYEVAKEVAIKEGGELVDVENIKHIAEKEKKKRLIWEDVEKSVSDWNVEKQLFYKQTAISKQYNNQNQNEDEDEDDEFGKELEDVLLVSDEEEEETETRLR